MQTQLIRTTVQLDSRLLKKVKLKMINEQMSFRQMVENSLEANISGRILPKDPKQSKKKVSFGGYNLGGIKGKLSRKEIYEDVEAGAIWHECSDLRPR